MGDKLDSWSILFHPFHNPLKKGGRDKGSR